MNAAGIAAGHNFPHGGMRGVVAAPFSNPFHGPVHHPNVSLGAILVDLWGRAKAVVDRSMDQTV